MIELNLTQFYFIFTQKKSKKFGRGAVAPGGGGPVDMFADIKKGNKLRKLSVVPGSRPGESSDETMTLKNDAQTRGWYQNQRHGSPFVVKLTISLTFHSLRLRPHCIVAPLSHSH